MKDPKTEPSGTFDELMALDPATVKSVTVESPAQRKRQPLPVDRDILEPMLENLRAAGQKWLMEHGKLGSEKKQ